MDLSDGDQIRNLLGRYCDLVDAADFDGVGALFADGRLATDDGTVLATGTAEVVAMFRRTVRLHDGSPRTKHVVVNTQLSGDDSDAVARSSYVVFQAIDGVLPLQPIITGRYVDAFRRPHAAWVWTERRFSVDLTGDLSHHMLWDLGS